jgi:hypothetical protein
VTNAPAIEPICRGSTEVGRLPLVQGFHRAVVVCRHQGEHEMRTVGSWGRLREGAQVTVCQVCDCCTALLRLRLAIIEICKWPPSHECRTTGSIVPSGSPQARCVVKAAYQSPFTLAPDHTFVRPQPRSTTPHFCTIFVDYVTQ